MSVEAESASPELSPVATMYLATCLSIEVMTGLSVQSVVADDRMDFKARNCDGDVEINET